jgi:hypothetical protein
MLAMLCVGRVEGGVVYIHIPDGQPELPQAVAVAPEYEDCPEDDHWVPLDEEIGYNESVYPFMY